MSARVLASLLTLACSDAVGVAAQGEKKGAQIDETKLVKRPRKVECIGNTTVSLVGVSLRLQDVAIEATGGCKVVIRNSHVSGSIAIQLVGPAEVTIENSIVEGQTNWIEMSGDTTATVKSSTIRGGTEKVGNATVKDLGDNVWK